MSLLTIAITVGVLLAIAGAAIALKVWCEVQAAERVFRLARARAWLEKDDAAKRWECVTTHEAAEDIHRGAIVVIGGDNMARLWRADDDSDAGATQAKTGGA
ncbi:hypothetical protein [Rubrivivax sp. JA1026]|uniref:hypothetical protein n=1 Tax=Rubrivivax sp. JA1026 TaxID=2710888 RepID=UPI0013E997D4|nr:hypothetical protein [Rubrivivax sp. JA1026]